MIIIRDDSNLSFAKLYEKLTAEGIKNIDHLVNIDLELYGRDPYANEIDNVLKRKVMFNVIDDFWYFIRNVVRIPIPGGSGFDIYEINEANFAALSSIIKGVDVYSNNPRYLLTTTTASVYYLWRIVRSNILKNVEICEPFELAILTNRAENHKLIKNKIKELNNLLPGYIKVNNEFIDDVIKPYVKITDKKQAIEFVSSLESNLFISDFEFIENMDIIVEQLTAIKAWKNIQVWATSSVGKYESKSKLAADRLIMRSATRWHNKFFNLGLDFVKFVYINIPYKRLVENPEEWFDTMERILDGDEDAIRREVLMLR